MAANLVLKLTKGVFPFIEPFQARLAANFLKSAIKGERFILSYNPFKKLHTEGHFEKVISKKVRTKVFPLQITYEFKLRKVIKLFLVNCPKIRYYCTEPIKLLPKQ